MWSTVKRLFTEMFKSINQYFKNKIYEVHLFRLIGIRRNEYATFQIISIPKKNTKTTWLFNNLYFPLIVIFFPYILTIVHIAFNTIPFNKSFLDLAITGSFTMLGINVLRSASTNVTEKFDDLKIPDEYAGNLGTLKDQLNGIKGKLRSMVVAFTFVGGALYLIQVGQFINSTNNWIYLFFAIILICTSLSIIFGRLIYLIETNFMDNDEVVRLLFKKLINQTNDFNQLADQLSKQGL